MDLCWPEHSVSDEWQEGGVIPNQMIGCMKPDLSMLC